MFIFDMTNPITLLLITIATVLLIFLSQEIKKSLIAAIPLFSFLILLIIHTVQILTITEEFKYLLSTLSYCMILDFIFVFITFIAYLWVDDIECRAFNKKSIDNSLDWLWKKI